MAPQPADLQPNAVLAGNLREYADLLRQQGAEGFRVAAYERAAGVIEGLDRPLGRRLRARGPRRPDRASRRRPLDRGGAGGDADHRTLGAVGAAARRARAGEALSHHSRRRPGARAAHLRRAARREPGSAGNGGARRPPRRRRGDRPAARRNDPHGARRAARPAAAAPPAADEAAPAGRDAPRRRSRISRKGRGRRLAPNRAQALQSERRGLAADPARDARRVAISPRSIPTPASPTNSGG